MMRQIFRKGLVAAGLVVVLGGIAWMDHSWAAQYGGNNFFLGEPAQVASSRASLSIFTDRLGHHLIAAILGALLGVFFSDKLRKFRRWAFLAAVIIFTGAMAWHSVIVGDIAVFIIVAGVTYYFLRDIIIAGKKKKPTTFGSAEWADLEHLQQNELIGREGFFLGVFPTRDGSINPIHYTGDRHLLTVAPTRSGKGVSSIIPNLLTYEGSAVVIDPKGENAMITATRRGKGDKKLGIKGMEQTVHVVDPWGITGLPSSRFNPLDWLVPADPDINENAMLLADSIITPHAGGGRDQFWDEEAKALLMGILLYVALDEEEKAHRTMGRVRDIISLGGLKLNELLNKMVKSSNYIVKSAGTRTLSKEERLQSSVLAALQSHTHFLDSPSIRKSLSASDFKFEDLKASKMTIYLVLPADRLNAFGRWLRLLIQQALTVNARNIEVKPEKPILFMLDEMAAMGRLSMIEQAFGLMAGFGMQIWGIIQDLSQLHRIYGDGWQTFIGNSGVIQYFGSRDLMTAEYFSKLCGVATIEKFSISRSIARAFSSSSSSPGQGSSTSNSVTHSEGVTEDVTQRHLAFPDELMVLRDNKQVVFVESLNPIPAKKIKWFEDDYLKNLGVNINQKKEGPKDKGPIGTLEEQTEKKESKEPPSKEHSRKDGGDKKQNVSKTGYQDYQPSPDGGMDFIQSIGITPQNKSQKQKPKR